MTRPESGSDTVPGVTAPQGRARRVVGNASLELRYLSAGRRDADAPARVTAAGAAAALACFTPGTLIATPRGEVMVEGLHPGDRVITRDNGMQPVRWIGGHALRGPALARLHHLRPVRIRQGALGHGLPERDMIVSPNHRMLVNKDKSVLHFDHREVLVAAKHLTGLEGVTRLGARQLTYLHLLFDRHEVILANGAWTESFRPGQRTLDGLGNAQRNELLELFPDLGTRAGLADYAPARGLAAGPVAGVGIPS